MTEEMRLQIWMLLDEHLTAYEKHCRAEATLRQPDPRLRNPEAYDLAVEKSVSTRAALDEAIRAAGLDAYWDEMISVQNALAETK